LPETPQLAAKDPVQTTHNSQLINANNIKQPYLHQLCPWVVLRVVELHILEEVVGLEFNNCKNSKKLTEKNFQKIAEFNE